MYGKCKQAVEAENVFSSTIRNRDAIMWNSMLTAYADSGDGTKALQAYVEMQRQGIPQDQHTFVISLQAACKLGGKQRCESALPDLGEALFLDAERRGFAGNSFIGNALIGLYGTCGDAMKAEEIFRGMHDRRDVSWNALMSAYMERGEEAKALRLYSRMRREGARPNRATYLVAIRACCARLLDVVTAAFSSEDRRSQAVFAVEIGRALHADAHAEGLVSDAAIASALVRMYGKLGLVSEAEVVFDGLARRNVVTWNAMLSAYAEQDRAENTMELFCRMMMSEDDGGVAALDDVTLICILQASGSSCRIESCREAHFILTSLGFRLTPALATALVHAYGRCALANDAREVVHALPLAVDAVLWSACIDAIAQASECAMSILDAFENMRLAGLEPDRITFVSILSACSHAGLADTGVECCEAMAKLFGPKLDPKHYALMIDLHGRAGNFRKVANLLERMPTYGDDDLPVDFSPVCSSLRGVCRIHKNVEM
jgi:pentatricopeptide repeat protein